MFMGKVQMKDLDNLNMLVYLCEVSSQKITDSFRHAFNGILLFIKSERNAKIHFMATVIAIGIGLYFQLNPTEWLWILLAISLVWIAEMANTAIEELCDKLSPEISSEIKKVKDISAGFVLIASLFALAVGTTIFASYLL